MQYVANISKIKKAFFVAIYGPSDNRAMSIASPVQPGSFNLSPGPHNFAQARSSAPTWP